LSPCRYTERGKSIYYSNIPFGQWRKGNISFLQQIPSIQSEKVLHSHKISQERERQRLGVHNINFD
jgi:hypothetical protein